MSGEVPTNNGEGVWEEEMNVGNGETEVFSCQLEIKI